MVNGINDEEHMILLLHMMLLLGIYVGYATSGVYPLSLPNAGRIKMSGPMFTNLSLYNLIWVSYMCKIERLWIIARFIDMIQISLKLFDWNERNLLWVLSYFTGYWVNRLITNEPLWSLWLRINSLPSRQMAVKWRQLYVQFRAFGAFCDLCNRFIGTFPALESILTY